MREAELARERSAKAAAERAALREAERQRLAEAAQARKLKEEQEAAAEHARKALLLLVQIEEEEQQPGLHQIYLHFPSQIQDLMPFYCLVLCTQFVWCLQKHHKRRSQGLQNESILVNL